MSRDITWAHDQKDMWLSKWESLNLRQHCTKFDAFRSCRSGNKTFLFCHVTSTDHMIKGPYGFAKGSLSTKVTTVLSLMVIGLVEVEMIKRFYFLCDILWQNYQRDKWFGNRKFLTRSPHQTKSCGRPCGSRDKTFLICYAAQQQNIA